MSEIIVHPKSPEETTSKEALKPKTKWLQRWTFEVEMNPIQSGPIQSNGQSVAVRSKQSKIPIRRKQLKSQIKRYQSKIPIPKQSLKCVRKCGFKTFKFQEFCVHLKLCPWNTDISK